MADLLSKIDWAWWFTEEMVRLDWWPGADHFWYWGVCRLNIMLMAAAGFTVTLAFVLTCLKRSGIEFILWDDSRD